MFLGSHNKTVSNFQSVCFARKGQTASLVDDLASEQKCYLDNPNVNNQTGTMWELAKTQSPEHASRLAHASGRGKTSNLLTGNVT